MPRSSSKRVTLEEVARVAGVSRATASRVVNGVTTVDETIRAAVRRAIEDTGYVPNPAARALVTRRADAVALVLPEESRLLGDPFFGQVVRGVMTVLGPSGVHLVLMTMDANTRDQVLGDLRRGRLDGVVLIHTDRADPLPRLLIEERHPVVVSSRPVVPLPVTYVDVDQPAGGALAARHLASLRRNRIVTIAGPQHTTAGQDRLIGFRDALGDPDLPWVEGDFTRESGAVGMAQLLRAHPGLDAVFAASDLMAQGALAVLRESGRSVPADVAVVGFDDSSAALACDPPLTTVRQPVEDMAAEMARLLLRQVDDPDTPVTASVFPPTLVHRGSA
ncbi:LacI family DNA-binding transcriptional regulator [Actinophytocola gossypii]|uniref:LacI family DNA-binding transcriptional regulator n=1 Tax=Actinophytocola gossypii TaxID=2812003 RepID=A0ABT2JIX4_9PSEU|nr:LacI family DNA-binding transcriptional regulator [Actinophytocola gossypii]MCT2587666.1 LacI family DNA-binding transcriptional regulator [Actinophytocola gossypii]